jgi:hypothetical protein
MDTITIREIIDQVNRGQIRIPAFQRGFVWDPDRVAYLMDSIYKKYPFGSLLLWRTREKLKVERDLGPFKLPEPKVDYPVDYVLDGQQRITSIFSVFQTELEMSPSFNWLDIFFDLDAAKSPQDTQFVALAASEVDSKRHFPLKSLFDTAEYRKATKQFEDSVAARIDEMQAVFKETLIPVQVSKTDDKATVAIIFERVNRQGVELDTLQLLSAWTWSEEFQLQEQFSDLAEQLGPFGFGEVGGDTNLLLRCCSAVLTGDAAPEALMTLNGSHVRKNFDQVTNGVKFAVDYFRTHFKVESLENLPFNTLLVPLSVFFATAGNKEVSVSNEQRAQINRWFWRSALSRRYSSGVLRTLKSDIAAMNELRHAGKSDLGNFPVTINPEFFTENVFGMGNVNTKTLILMLAQSQPLSFVSGAPVDLAKTLKESNRAEFHHIMPKAFLHASGQGKLNDSLLANFCFLSRSDNRALGGVAPSAYKAQMQGDIPSILEHAIIPESIFLDDYELFIKERSQMLAAAAKKLCEI